MSDDEVVLVNGTDLTQDEGIQIVGSLAHQLPVGATAGAWQPSASAWAKASLNPGLRATEAGPTLVA